MKQQKLAPREIEKLKASLLARRKAIAGGVLQIRASSQEIGQDGIQDMADEASNLASQEVLMSLSESQRRTLREVDEALDRIEEGSYGICEDCGTTISLKRLRIKPFARYCVQCQDFMEKHEGTSSEE